MWRGLIALLFFLMTSGLAVAAPACQRMDFEGAAYTVCRFDTRVDSIVLRNLDQSGEPYGNFSALRADLAQQGHELVFAMNAGMYDEALKPIGLYVEEGRQSKKLNRRAGGGNFHLKPNGVFYVDGQKAGVMETEAFAKSGLKPAFATQSGPMLVVDGEIHPKFSADGPSRKRRNGVGQVDDHTIIFAITEGFENFYDFARLFRDGLNCRNALFFDGSISSLYDKDSARNDSFLPLGPMVAVIK